MDSNMRKFNVKTEVEDEEINVKTEVEDEEINEGSSSQANVQLGLGLIRLPPYVQPLRHSSKRSRDQIASKEDKTRLKRFMVEIKAAMDPKVPHLGSTSPRSKATSSIRNICTGLYANFEAVEAYEEQMLALREQYHDVGSISKELDEQNARLEYEKQELEMQLAKEQSFFFAAVEREKILTDKLGETLDRLKSSERLHEELSKRAQESARNSIVEKIKATYPELDLGFLEEKPNDVLEDDHDHEPRVADIVVLDD